MLSICIYASFKVVIWVEVKIIGHLLHVGESM